MRNRPPPPPPPADDVADPNIINQPQQQQQPQQPQQQQPQEPQARPSSPIQNLSQSQKPARSPAMHKSPVRRAVSPTPHTYDSNNLSRFTRDIDVVLVVVAKMMRCVVVKLIWLLDHVYVLSFLFFVISTTKAKSKKKSLIYFFSTFLFAP